MEWESDAWCLSIDLEGELLGRLRLVGGTVTGKHLNAESGFFLKREIYRIEHFCGPSFETNGMVGCPLLCAVTLT